MATPVSGPSGGGPAEQTPPSRLRLLAIPVVLGALTLFVVLSRQLDRRFGEVSDAFSRQELHVEKATAIRRDARKVYVLMLESWLASDDARGARLPRVMAAIDAVGDESAEFAALAPLDTDEDPLTRALTRDVATFCHGATSSSRIAGASEAAPELERAMALVDEDVAAILSHTAQDGALSGAQGTRLSRQRAWLQVAFLVWALGAGAVALVWQRRLRARTRLAELERQEHERTARLQSQFFASMSHELRTPLVAIRGFASDVEEHPGVDDVVRERSRRIHQEAITLLAMINNVLDAAKIDAGEVQLLLENVGLDALLARCVARCQGLTRDKKVSIELDVAPDLPPVRADFVKLQQVFTNLVANAIKFTDEGRVHVRARRGDAASAGEVLVEVEDCGIGIAPEALALIWTPFKQADPTVSRRYGGTGLGLSIARGIVELHGGSIDVQSAVGRGSTFRVLLPAGTVVRATGESDALPA